MIRLARRRQEPRRDDELDALLVAGRAAVSSRELGEALVTILDGALGLVAGDEGSVQLLDPATMTLQVVAARGLGEEARRQRVAMGQGISGTVAVTGQALLLPSAVDVDRFGGFVPKRRRIYGALSVPLRGADEVTIGVLNVNKMRPGERFTQHHLRLVSLFAETAALAIANSRLLVETRRHASELETLRAATMRLGATLDLDQVAELTLQEALAVAGSDTGFLAVATGDGDLELVRYAGFAHEPLRAVLSSPSFRRLDDAPDIRVVDDAANDPVLRAVAADLWERSLALLPLRTAEGKAGGFLGIALGVEAPSDARRLLRTFAGQAGLALSNALLHRQVAGKEQELDTIVTALDLPIVLLDEHRRFRAINPAAAAAFRLSPDFELGRPARGKLPRTIEQLALDRADDVTAEIDVEVGHEVRVWRVTAATVRRGRGAGARVVILADVSTERDLDRRKSDFLAVIGHELRTPLTNIKGFAQTLVARGSAITPDVRTRSLDTILTQTERLERLIEDLLFVSRVEQGRPPLSLGWEDLAEVCMQIVAEAGRRFPHRTIRFHAPDEDVPALTDRVKVEQILMHLLDNAMKFSEDDRPVDVRVTATDRTATVAVRDEGQGIYSRDLDRIFEAFTQLDPSATRRHGGIGMGLHVSATLAEALGGGLDVESALGKGSTFSLVIPRETVAAEAQA